MYAAESLPLITKTSPLTTAGRTIYVVGSLVIDAAVVSAGRLSPLTPHDQPSPEAVAQYLSRMAGV